jgi:hypothetical protein
MKLNNGSELKGSEWVKFLESRINDLQEDLKRDNTPGIHAVIRGTIEINKALLFDALRKKGVR